MCLSPNTQKIEQLLSLTSCLLSSYDPSTDNTVSPDW